MSKNTKRTKVTSVKTQVATTPLILPARKAPAAAAAAAQQSPSPAKAENRAAGVCLEFVRPQAKKVCVAGSFNGWKPDTTPLVNTGDGSWVAKLTVKPGRYEYLFVADGEWLPDPKARESVQNPFGGKNSVIIV
jgi:1,4-alpha-glucan branching enzyme